MAQGRATLMMFMAVLIGACNAKTAEGAGSTTEGSTNPPIKQDAPTVAYDQDKKSVAETPTPSSVLYFIFQKDGDGASTYEVENGSWVSYWYGYRFEFASKQYFTGFAYQTPDKYGKADEENFPNPDAKATITQATYILTHPGTDKPWTFEGAQRFVGEFGGYEKANEIDPSRRPLEYRTQDKRMVLGIPTWYLASGSRIESYELFLFDPKEILKVEDARWSYLGNVETGEDNGAACDELEGKKLRCVKRVGELSFLAEQGAALPMIRVATIGAGATVTDPDEGATVEYRYDASTKQYRQ